jgi:hypothetical protein
VKWRRWFLVVLFLSAAAARGNDASADSAESARTALLMAIEDQKNGRASRTEFRRAAEKFAEIRNQGHNAPQLHQAEGNAWLLADEKALAILAYRRWQRFEPNNSLASESLNHARAQVAYATSTERTALTPVEAWPMLRLRLRRWGLVGIALALVLGWFALARWVISRGANWFIMAVLTLAIGTLITTGWLVERNVRQAQNSRMEVVVLRPELLRSGDGFSYLARRESPLPAGVEAVVRHQRGSWLQVELADGNVGWLPEASVRRLD